MSQSHTDTIFAPATAPGIAGVAVIRLSGPHAYSATLDLSRKESLTPRVLHRADLYHPNTGDLIDRGMAVYFPGPASFTGEDVVELHLHGSSAILQVMGEVLSHMPHVRWAEPGEFSRRAFDNDKMDLTAAEGLADLLAAETEAQRKQALQQMDGALAKRLDGIRNKGINALAFMEATIDFPEDELPQDTFDRGRLMVEDLRQDLSDLIDTAKIGNRIRQGVSLVVVGTPNVGKSSLVNALAGWDAAIVSSTAGTTRDRVSVDLVLDGIPIKITDTAGLRDATDDIEAEGIRRTKVSVQTADLKIAVFSAESWPNLDDPTWQWVDNQTLIVVNKADLNSDAVSMTVETPTEPVFVSALHQEGLGNLTERLRGNLRSILTHQVGESAPLTRERHRAIAESAIEALDRALMQDDLELKTEDLRLAVRELGRMTGRVDVEDVLDRIFSEFCIGK